MDLFYQRREERGIYNPFLPTDGALTDGSATIHRGGWHKEVTRMIGILFSLVRVERRLGFDLLTMAAVYKSFQPVFATT